MFEKKVIFLNTFQSLISQNKQIFWPKLLLCLEFFQLFLLNKLLLQFHYYQFHVVVRRCCREFHPFLDCCLKLRNNLFLYRIPEEKLTLEFLKKILKEFLKSKWRCCSEFHSSTVAWDLEINYLYMAYFTGIPEEKLKMEFLKKNSNGLSKI